MMNESCFPDFWDLEKCPGYFACASKAGWLQAHRNDPYWLGHQIYGVLEGKVDFVECWELARELKMEWES